MKRGGSIVVFGWLVLWHLGRYHAGIYEWTPEVKHVNLPFGLFRAMKVPA